MIALAMAARALLLVLGCVLAAPIPAAAQAFFTAAPRPDLRLGPLGIRAAVTPAQGPVQIRLLFGVMAPAGAEVPDLYLLWPGEVKGDPALGARDPELAKEVTALRYDVIDEGRLPLRSRNVSAGRGAGNREVVPGGAPYVSFVQTGGSVGLSAPGTWIRIPSTLRLADADWITTLEIPSLSTVKARKPTWLERLVLGERFLFAISFNEVRGRPLFRMYLTHRDRLLRLGDAPAEMVVSFSQSDHLKIDSVTPATAIRGVSETAESTETVSLFLDGGEGITPQRLSVQYGYFSRTQAIGVVAVPLVLLLLGYAIGPLIGRASLHVAQRLAGRFHVSRWDGLPRERTSGVVLSRDVLARIRPGATTQDEVLRLCGPDVEVLEHFPSDNLRTLVYRGRHVRPQTRRLIGMLASVRHLEVERHEVSIELADGVVRDVKADIRRSRAPVGDGGGPAPA
jgi:hypothetical protein